MLRFVTTAARRHPVLVVLAWLLITGAGFAVGNGVFARLTTTVGTVPGSDSARGTAQLKSSNLNPPSLTGVVSGRPITDPSLRAEVKAAVQDIGAISGVARVTDTYSTGSAGSRRSRSRSESLGRIDQAVLFDITLRPQFADRTATAVRSRLRAIKAPHIVIAGGPLTDDEFTRQAAADTHRAEILAAPLLLVLLLVIFGALVAAGLPLLIAIAGACTSLGLLFGFSQITDVSVYAIQVTTMLSIGLAVDYSLLVVNRFREERARTPDPAVALERACASAGRAVLFSGLTVSVSLAGLLVFPDPFLRSLGFAGASVVVADMLAALTLLPALLALTGHRIRPARQRDGRLLRGLTGVAQRRPLIVLVGAVCCLLALATPVLGLRLSTSDPRSLPGGSQTRTLYETLGADFPSLAGPNPITLVAATGPGDPALAGYRAQVARTPGVAVVMMGHSGDGYTVLQAMPAHPVNSDPTARAVAGIRRIRAPFPVAVTGDAARLADYRASIVSRAPWAIGLVALVTLLLLFAFTGSILLPVKAVLTNLLGLSAGLGVVVWVFQEGHGAGLFGTPTMAGIDLTVPVVVAAIAFGLSTDYEVFLLSRIREEWATGVRPAQAVAAGVRQGGAVILAAAALMAVAFAGFLTGGFAPIKEVGLGLVVAVALDALVVRMLLVPALLTELGGAAWWVPRPLRRLQRRPESVERVVAQRPAEEGAVRGA